MVNINVEDHIAYSKHIIDPQKIITIFIKWPGFGKLYLPTRDVTFMDQEWVRLAQYGKSPGL